MKKFIIILGLSFSLISCEQWLNLTPHDRIGEEDLFKTEEGFQQALIGIYARMSKADLYGVELSFGMADLLGQYWNIFMNHNKHYPLPAYDYQHTDAKDIIDKVWYEMYKAIAETNNLLQALEQKDEHSLKHYTLLKGEALALRAFLHWELLEYFGPMDMAKSEEKAIPYRETYSKDVVPFLPSKLVFAKIKQDLENAISYLEEDPIRTIKHVSDYNKTEKLQGNVYHDPFLDQRNIRMNYFAVKALLAKAYLVEGDKQKAYNFAQDIITSGKFSLVKEEDLVVVDSKKDLHYSDEIIFSLYVGKQQSMVEKYLGYEKEINYSYYFLPAAINLVYTAGKGSTVDYRRTYWFDATDKFTKYKAPAQLEPAYRPEIPIIRLSELYYIATEAQIGVQDNIALSQLNEIRTNRNLGMLIKEDITETESILKHLVYDMRKDFWGEGKIFKTYKRLNMNILDGDSEVPASKAIFILPIPKEELEAGGN